jgi:hypothetical protein
MCRRGAPCRSGYGHIADGNGAEPAVHGTAGLAGSGVSGRLSVVSGGCPARAAAGGAGDQRMGVPFPAGAPGVFRAGKPAGGAFWRGDRCSGLASPRSASHAAGPPLAARLFLVVLRVSCHVPVVDPDQETAGSHGGRQTGTRGSRVQFRNGRGPSWGFRSVGGSTPYPHIALYATALILISSRRTGRMPSDVQKRCLPPRAAAGPE